jgi:hypothetical protein
MNISNHGVTREKGEAQPTEKERAQTVHRSDPKKKSASREATRDPKLNDAEKTPGSGVVPDDDGDAPTG